MEFIELNVGTNSLPNRWNDELIYYDKICRSLTTKSLLTASKFRSARSLMKGNTLFRSRAKFSTK